MGEENITIDFNNHRFILVDYDNRTEHVISVQQAANFVGVYQFTEIAQHELEEAQYDEAIRHYLGDDEAHPQTNSKA